MKEIRFVDVGEGITEGHIQKWLVKDGDSVKEDQPIVQIETDKAIVNLPAPITGKVKISAAEGSDVRVGELIASVGTDAEVSSAPQAQTPVQPKPAEESKPTVSQPAENIPSKTIVQNKEIIATPSVRKMAHDLSVDISKVAGTGPNERILENDIRATATQTTTPPPPKPKFSELLEETHKEEIERIPLTQTRKAIAKNMEASWTIPRAVHMDLIDATSLYDVVYKEKERMQNEYHEKLTLLPFVIKATIQALKENPNFNASYDHETMEIIKKKYYNIGIAAEAPDGLKVAVVKDADTKSVAKLAAEIQELHKKVVDQTITLEEMRDSTFTISNIGSLGGGYLAVPMINYPEVAILAINKVRDMPVVKDGKIVIGKVLPFSISFDHRVVDGAEAVKFGNSLIKYLEDIEFLEML